MRPTSGREIMRLSILITIFVALACPVAGFAKDPQQAKADVARELAQCGGYYFALAVREGAPSEPSEVSDAFMERGKQALEMAKKYEADEKRINEIGGAAAELCLIEAVRAGWDKATQTYAEACDALLQDPEKRLRELQKE